MGKLLKKKCYGGKMSEGGDVFKKTPRNMPSDHEKGVNKASSQLDPGTSEAGVHVMAGDMEGAKWRHLMSKKQGSKMGGPTSGKSGFAKGGMLTADNYQSECHADCNDPCEVHEQSSGYAEMTHPESMPTHQGLTDMGEQSESHDMDMVGKALMRRKQMLSQGGKVANSDKPEADFMPNEFDYLHLNDGLEDNSGSGNEHGDDTLFDDAVAKAMMKRKKQRNPVPA